MFGPPQSSRFVSYLPEQTRGGIRPLYDLPMSVPAEPEPVPPPEPVSAPSPEPVSAPSPEPVSDLLAFKNCVREYVSVEARLTAAAAEGKALRARRAELQTEICEFMEENELSDLHTRDMRLKIKTATVKVPLKKADIRARTERFFGESERARRFIEEVYEDRDTVQRTSLCKMKPRASV